jgi:hypothetical protein
MSITGMSWHLNFLRSELHITQRQSINADVIQLRVMCEDIYRVQNLKNEKVEGV